MTKAQPHQQPAWECFVCEDGFHYRPGVCPSCGVDRRLVPVLTEA